MKKQKFEPKISRVRLEPEQAVLLCCSGARAGPDCGLASTGDDACSCPAARACSAS